MPEYASLNVGDRMIWSLQLAQQLAERQAREPEGVDTVIVEIMEIYTNPDGTKTVVMRNVP